MITRRGPQSTLTPPQVRRVLSWHARREAFRRSHGTVKELASRLHVPQRTVYDYLGALNRNPGLVQSGASTGRPRLSNTKILGIAAWLKKEQRFLAKHGTPLDLARRLGVKESRIFDCIRRANANRLTRPWHRNTSSPRERDRELQKRSSLLRAWPGLFVEPAGCKPPGAPQKGAQRSVRRLRKRSSITRR